MILVVFTPSIFYHTHSSIFYGFLFGGWAINGDRRIYINIFISYGGDY